MRGLRTFAEWLSGKSGRSRGGKSAEAPSLVGNACISMEPGAQQGQTSMTTTRRSTRLLNALAGYEQVLVVTHDNPDPDAIASGLGLALADQRETRQAGSR